MGSSASQSTNSSDSISSTSTSFNVKVEGGDRSICSKTACDLDAYSATVDESNAEIISFKLSSLMDLLTGDIRPSTDHFYVKVNSDHRANFEGIMKRYLESKAVPDVAASTSACAGGGNAVSAAVQASRSSVFAMLAALACGVLAVLK